MLMVARTFGVLGVVVVLATGSAVALSGASADPWAYYVAGLALTAVASMQLLAPRARLRLHPRTQPEAAAIEVEPEIPQREQLFDAGGPVATERRVEPADLSGVNVAVVYYDVREWTRISEPGSARTATLVLTRDDGSKTVIELDGLLERTRGPRA